MSLRAVNSFCLARSKPLASVFILAISSSFFCTSALIFATSAISLASADSLAISVADFLSFAAALSAVDFLPLPPLSSPEMTPVTASFSLAVSVDLTGAALGAVFWKSFMLVCCIVDFSGVIIPPKGIFDPEVSEVLIPEKSNLSPVTLT